MLKAVQYLNERVGISATKPWAAVVDFTSYKWRDLQSVTKALRNKTQLYIFISTDSLYNNTPFNGNPIKESLYPLDQMYRQQKGTRISDKYGYVNVHSCRTSSNARSTYTRQDTCPS